MSFGWLRAALKRLRHERLAAIGLAGLVLVTGFVFGIAPRALDATGDVVLREEVRSADLFARNVQFLEDSRIPAANDADPLVRVAERGRELTERLPASLRGLIEGGGWQADSGRHQLHERSDPLFFRFRFQEGIDEHIRYAAGRPPGATIRELDGLFVNQVEVDDVVVFEVALAQATADEFGMALGDTLVLYGDETDPLIGRGPELQYRAVELVGTYNVVDTEDPWWLGDRLAQRPVVRVLGANLDVRFLDAAAILAPLAYPAFMEATGDQHSPIRYTWRRFVDPDRLDATTVGALLVDLRRAQTTFPSANPTPAFETGYRTGLLALIERQQAQWRSAVAILAVVAVGPAVVAAAAVALVAVLAASRRRASLAVSRSRGASGTQLVLAVVAEALLLTVPAVALAILAARLVIPGGPNSPTTIAAVAIAASTTAILVVTSVPRASESSDVGAARGGRDTGIVRRPTERRLVMEGLLVVLALGGAWLLRERGVRGTSAAGALETADPLLAAVPALVGLGAGIAAVRLFPLPMRLFAWLAAARRDLVPVLAMRRATSGTGAGPVLVVLLATATIGAFCSAALVHLERAAETVAWEEVGAAYRITPGGGPLPGTLEALELPGAEAAAEIYRTAVPVGLGGPRVELAVIDPEAYRAVTAGTPADPGLPEELFGPGGSPIPAVVSRSLGDRPDGVSPGEVFELSVEGYTLSYLASEVRDTFPGIPPGSHFAIVSRAHFNALAPSARLDPTTVLVRAPDDRAVEFRSASLAIVEGGTVESRAQRTAGLRASPVVGAVRFGIIAAAVVAALYAALGVAAALALAGLARSTEVAHLRTLGLSRREAFGLVVVEHGPTVVAAFAAGLGLGFGLFLLLRPGLGLSALVGSAIDIPLTVDAGQLALVLLAIVGIVMLGLVAAAILQRAAAPVAAIRRGFE